MYIEREDKTQVAVVLDADEAALVLETLETLADDLGEEAEALARALREAGIQPPGKPDHIRYEYMPPND